ncbi:MAG: HTTM domain-containing protein [bacterium]|nr:HTTM domain-containing protein [bacterium]
MIKLKLNQKIDVSSLVAFRILMGLLMSFSMVRFMAKGWVNELYVKPTYYFAYWGFSWIRPWPEWGMYLHFSILALLGLMVAAGLYYRFSVALFFIGFTFIELIDKSTYLNHYYFLSLVSFLMIFMPLHRSFSLDVWKKPGLKLSKFPAWPLAVLRAQIGLVYVFAGLAKLNPDWLLHALPLRLWLPGHSDIPILGSLFVLPITAYLMSWGGALFDLSIPLFLSWKKSRALAYICVVVFHVLTWKLFRIGVFPWVMMIATLCFFSPDWPKRLYSKLRIKKTPHLNPESQFRNSAIRECRLNNFGIAALGIYFVFQVLFPFRYLIYPGNLFWTEQGYRFSWRVMLMEKTGSVDYTVFDPASKKTWLVSPRDYLTPRQHKQMSTQPDMILALAHHIAKDFAAQGYPEVEVKARVKTSLNGRPNRTLIDPQVNLAQANDGWLPKSWILPYSKGLSGK